MKTFKEEIIDLFKDMTVAALESLVSFFKDLASFRNRLVIYIAFLGLLVILYNRNTEVIIAVVSIISLVFSYYFKQRNDSLKIEVESKEEEENEENEKDR